MAERVAQIPVQQHLVEQVARGPLYMTVAHLAHRPVIPHFQVGVVLGDRKALERREAGGILHPT